MQEPVDRNTKVSPPVNGMKRLTIAPDSLPQGPGSYGSGDAAPLLTSSSPSPPTTTAAANTLPPPSPRRPPKPPIHPNGGAFPASNGSSRNGTPSTSPRCLVVPRPPWIATTSNSDAYSQLVCLHCTVCLIMLLETRVSLPILSKQIFSRVQVCLKYPNTWWLSARLVEFLGV
jgi:hypothetical protein